MRLPKGRYTLHLGGQNQSIGKSLSLSQVDVDTDACASPDSLPLQDGLTHFNFGLANLVTPLTLKVRVLPGKGLYIKEIRSTPYSAGPGDVVPGIAPSSLHDISLCKSCNQPLSECLRKVEFQTFKLEIPGDTIVRINATDKVAVETKPTKIVFLKGSL